MTDPLPHWRPSLRSVNRMAIGCGAAAVFYWLYVGAHKAGAQVSMPTWVESWLQAGFVIALTVLAFLSHLVEKDPVQRPGQTVWLWLSMLPALIFFAAMVHGGHHDAAVFAMAFVAIYVAAEHYVALRDQTETMTAVANRLEDQVGNMENALGTKDAQKRLFQAYAKTPNAGAGIYAIQRYFDIDETWWHKTAAQAWGRYEERRDATGATLYDALIQGRRNKVLFVCAMPYPFETAGGDKCAKQFGEFIGLVWYYVVLQKVRRAPKMHGIDTDYQIKIAPCSNWVYVVDDTVFQILGEAPRNILSRELTFNMDPQDGEERKMRDRFVSWAIDDIKRGAGRGIPAREYICSVMLRAGLNLGWRANDPLNRSAIGDALTKIGFDQWHQCCQAAPQKYASCPQDYDIGTAKALCLCIMSEFMHEFGEPDIRKTEFSREVQ